MVMFWNNNYLSLDILRVPFITLTLLIWLNYIILTNGKIKDKEHLKLRCLVQVGPGRWTCVRVIWSIICVCTFMTQS